MKALLIILIVLTIIALIPVGVDGGYRNKTIILGVKIGFINLKLFPKNKKPLKAKKPKKPKKSTREAPKPEESEKTGRKSFNIRQILDIIKPALKALGSFRRKLTIEYFRLHYTFASDDPADTAMAYGRANAVAAAVMPLVDGAFNIRNRDVGFSFDFFSDKPQIDIWLTATIQIWELVYIAGAFGIDYLKLTIKRRKSRKKERNETNGQTSDR